MNFPFDNILRTGYTHSGNLRLPPNICNTQTFELRVSIADVLEACAAVGIPFLKRDEH
jgi:hypothetical protein